jgi:hypothetical protein
MHVAQVYMRILVIVMNKNKLIIYDILVTAD